MKVLKVIGFTAIIVVSLIGLFFVTNTYLVVYRENNTAYICKTFTANDLAPITPSMPSAPLWPDASPEEKQARDQYLRQKAAEADVTISHNCIKVSPNVVDFLENIRLIHPMFITG